MNAINSSPYAAKVDVFVGTLVTDNVSSNVQNTEMTLEHAEEVISATANIRREFFSKVLKTLGILKKETRGMPRRSQSPEIRPSSFLGRSDCSIASAGSPRTVELIKNLTIESCAYVEPKRVAIV
jgi:hypothetical protein